MPETTMSALRPLLSILAFAAMSLFSLLLVLGFLGRFHPAFDSLSHFRLHLAAAMTVLALLLVGTRFWKESLLSMMFGLAAISSALGYSVLPGLGPVHAGFQPKNEARATYRLLQLNLRFDNAEPARVLSLIGRLRPDIIVVEEVSAMWQRKLELLKAAYPYRFLCDGWGAVGGVAILSSRPFDEGADPKCLDDGSLAVVRVDLAGRRVEVAAMHLQWPWPFGQPRQLDRLTNPLSRVAHDAVLAGDLNATPWSAAARRVAEAAGLTQVPVAGATWLPHVLPEWLRFAGLPIDQLFAKGAVTVHSAEMLDAVGSDHLPLLMEFSLEPVHPEYETATDVAALEGYPTVSASP